MRRKILHAVVFAALFGIWLWAAAQAHAASPPPSQQSTCTPDLHVCFNEYASTPDGTGWTIRANTDDAGSRPTSQPSSVPTACGPGQCGPCQATARPRQTARGSSSPPSWRRFRRPPAAAQKALGPRPLQPLRAGRIRPLTCSLGARALQGPVTENPPGGPFASEAQKAPRPLVTTVLCVCGKPASSAACHAQRRTRP